MASKGEYLIKEKDGKLTKVAMSYNSENLVKDEYKTLENAEINDPALKRSFVYDVNGNLITTTIELSTWPSAADLASESSTPAEVNNPKNEMSIIDTSGNEALVVDGKLKVDAGEISVTAENLNIEDVVISDVGTTEDSLKVKHTGDVTSKSQTQYATSETNVQTWLGRENDDQLTLQYVNDAVSNQKTIFYALPSVAIDGNCLARRYYLSSGDVTGEHTYVGTWTQVMDDLIKPPPTNITLGGSLTTVENEIATTVIGALTATGGEAPHTFEVTSGGGLNVEVSGANLVVATGGIDGEATVSQPYTVAIKTTDYFGKEFSKNFSIAVTTNDILLLEFTNGTTAASVNYGDPADTTTIGTLKNKPGYSIGGAGTVTFSITNLDKDSTGGDMSNIRIDGDRLEVGPLTMDTTPGIHEIEITATDSLAPTAQTKVADFDITVVDTSVLTVSFDDDTQAADVDYADATGIDIGTLKSTGGVGDKTFSITDYGTLNKSPADQNIRIVTVGDDQVLEVGPAAYMNTGPPSHPSGTAHTIKITATDTVGQDKEQEFEITVGSTKITDIALSTNEVVDDAVADVIIGNLTCTGGVGDVAFTITDDDDLDNVKIVDTGSSTANFVVDTGGIVDDVGTYAVQFTATDTFGNVAYTETINITVKVSFADLKFLNFDAPGANEYIDMGLKADFNDTIGNCIDFAGTSVNEYLDIGGKSDFDDDDDFWFRRRSDDYTISWWMKMPASASDYGGGGYTYDKIVFINQDGDMENGIAAHFREDDFIFSIGKDDSTAGQWKALSVVDWQDGNWHHYAITYDASAKVAAGNTSTTGLVFYRDGEVHATTYFYYNDWLDADYEDNNTTINMRFGAGHYVPHSWTNDISSLAEIAIWKSVLSAGNISTIHNNGTPISVAGIDDANLKRYYRFAASDGTDTAGNHTATIGSAVEVITAYDDFFFRRRSDNWTISWWMRFPESTADWTGGTYPYDDRIFRCQNPSGENGIEMFIRARSVRFWYGKDGAYGGHWMLADVGDWQDGLFHHYTLTWDAASALVKYNADDDADDIGQYLKFYRDGNELTAWSTDAGGDFTIDGYNNVDGDEWFDDDYEDNNTTYPFRFGYPDPNSRPTTVFNPVIAIDEIAIWKTDLSASNITSIYNSGSPTTALGIDDTNLKRYYQFEGTGEHYVERFIGGNYRNENNVVGENRMIYLSQVFTDVNDLDTDENWSISIWFRHDSTVHADATGYVYFVGQRGSYQVTLSKGYPASNDISVQINKEGSDPRLDIDSLDYDDGEWHNVTVTYTPDFDDPDYNTTIGTNPATCNMLVYFDGVLHPATDTATSSGGLLMGDTATTNIAYLCANRSGQVYASMDLCHFSVFSKTLSASEVNSVLGADDKPKSLTGQADLECWLPLGDGYDLDSPSTVDTAIGVSAKCWDMSGNGRHGIPLETLSQCSDLAYTDQAACELAGETWYSGGNSVVNPSTNAVTGWTQTDVPVDGVKHLGVGENIFIAGSTSQDSKEKYTGRIGSAATVLEHYDNTKHFHCNDKDGFFDLPVFKDGGVNEIISIYKNWTYGMWFRPEVTTRGFFLTVGNYNPGTDAVLWINNQDGATAGTRIKIYETGSASSHEAIYGAGSDLFPVDLWSHFMVTFKSRASLAGVEFDLGAGGGTYDAGFTMYINGVRVPKTSGDVTTTHDLDGAPETCQVGALSGYTGYGAILGDQDNITLFNEHKSAAEVLAIYNEGHGKSHASDSSCKVWLRADSETTGDLTDEQTVTNNGDGVTYPCTVNFLGGTSEITVREF